MSAHADACMLLQRSLLAIVCLPVLTARGDDVKPRSQIVDAVDLVRRQIQLSIDQNAIPAISIALVNRDGIIWSEGFGIAQPETKLAANADTIYRVGSVSKLLTDVCIMQLVESGRLDLDEPVTKYLPEFRPGSDFEQPITLRMLMSHRSGLVRESPVGNYFDDSNPGLKATVDSLNQTELVYEPGARTKYSNAGVAVAGYVLERHLGQPFEHVLSTRLLEPLGMAGSSFDRRPDLTTRYADGLMWTLDGRQFPAPEFKLGTAPAGNLYASANDLGRLIQCLLQRGRIGDRTILQPDTLDRMWTAQFAGTANPSAYGLGFHLGKLDGHRRLGHGGAIYGFSTELAVLPDDNLGVVVISSRDLTNGVVTDIANFALRCMLTTGESDPPTRWKPSYPLPDDLARTLEGRFESGDEELLLVERDHRLFLHRGTFRRELRILGDELIADDAFGRGPTLIRHSTDRIELDGREWNRIEDPLPPDIPDRWQGLIGEYGWDHNTLYILEDHGQLYALIEWFFRYPLTEVGENRFAFPDFGMYHGEQLIFERDVSGLATGVTAASVRFARRDVGTPAGETFRIQPLLPIETLRKNAGAATPPVEAGRFRDSDLVEVAKLDASIRLDIRYATTNNFMGAVFYRQPRAFLQRPAAEALVRAHQRLKQAGFGLLIHDAYRPWFVTHMFFEATPDTMKDFVADPANGSRHNRGCAVDLTLYDLASGEPVHMVAGYDEFSPRAFPDYPGGTARQRWLRELLRDVMYSEGFSVYEYEWWHFDYRDWKQYRIGNKTFEQLAR